MLFLRVAHIDALEGLNTSLKTDAKIAESRWAAGRLISFLGVLFECDTE